MNNLEKIELMKLAVQLAISDESARLRLTPGHRQGQHTTELVAMIYKSLLETLLTDSA